MPAAAVLFNIFVMKNFLLLLVLTIVLDDASGQGKFADPRDGNVYNTVTVNGIAWMKENLRFTGIEGAYCFDNDRNNIPIYGALYEWKAAVKACPAGWHLPTGAQFANLKNTLEGTESWGKGPSESFNIQLGGLQDFEGIFSEVDESAYYWTSTEYDKDYAEYFSYLIIHGKVVIDISRKDDIADIHGNEKINRYSVRCVKD